MSIPLRFGSLFSGIGGLDLGLERAGMTCAWQVEVDPYCVAVLRKHWPDVPKFGDIKQLDETQLKPVDLICGGFPCQPVSAAGRQRGQADERWLWPEFARLIRVLRPRYVLLENATWVEWLMGFPIGWTVLERSEMPLSRKSRSGLGGRSSRTPKRLADAA